MFRFVAKNGHAHAAHLEFLQSLGTPFFHKMEEFQYQVMVVHDLDDMGGYCYDLAKLMMIPKDDFNSRHEWLVDWLARIKSMCFLVWGLFF